MSALQDIVIVEVAERPAGEYTAKLLADFGATVIKVERPGGAPTRAMGPFHKGESTLFHYLNTNKRSVVLDLDRAEDRTVLNVLLGKAHALIDDHDELWGRAHGLTSREVAGAHPHLVHCIVTPFGQDAPAEWQKARPINVINAGGWAYHSPSETPPDKPPLKGAGRFLSDYEAGIDAATCILASLHRQRQGMGGQFIDISEVEVQVNRIDCVLDRMLAGEANPGPERTAYDMGGPGTSFACRDGHIYIFMTTKIHWSGLVELMGEPEWAKAFPADWLEFHCTKESVADFRKHFAAWIASQDKVTVSEAAQKLGVAIVPVNTAADLPHNEQFIHRGFFQTVDHPVFGPVAYPTACYKLSASPVQVTNTAPALGDHDMEAL
ncbi:MAG TPA: CoA transferase [Sphingobium sp.]|uniref:CaiB/BaiF CoA transferase family protein n=1 Tax=Sphingobium sp. TaxID=1912891 RepID=UPI002ED060BA